MDRINGLFTILNSARKRVFQNKNLAAGVSGTQIDAGFMTDLQEEVVEFIEAAGLVPTAGVMQLKASTDIFYAWKYAALITNRAITTEDRGTILQCNAGCTGLTLPAVGGFDAGFLVGIQGGTAAITTITVTGGEVDGGEDAGDTTVNVGPGSSIIFQAQPSGWGVISATPDITTVHGKAYYGPGLFTFTVPAGVASVDVTMTGGGGPGGNCTSAATSGNFSGAGGGAGATAKFRLAVVPGQVLTGTVGAAGAATSFFGVVAGGGSVGGAYASGNTAGAAGGSVTGAPPSSLQGALVAIGGSPGSDGMGSGQIFAGNGAASFWGGGGRAGSGGGVAGIVPGAGGGGAYGTASGAGGAGGGGCMLFAW